ncbi:hypothetical protein SRHO_G00259300 [Serrasalmus rhombeus]
MLVYVVMLAGINGTAPKITSGIFQDSALFAVLDRQLSLHLQLPDELHSSQSPCRPCASWLSLCGLQQL